MNFDKIFISINRINFQYPNNPDFNLFVNNIRIYQGKISAIIGHSGSGKSTFLDIIGFIDSYPNILCDVDYFFHSALTGISYSTLMSQKEYLNNIKRTKFGYIFQNAFFIPEISIIENLKTSILVNNISKTHYLSSLEQELLIKEMLNSELFLEKEKKTGDEFIWECSGGQLHRFALIRALAHEPEVLFLDEPTGDLDSSSAETVFSYLSTWIRAKGSRTIVLVTHDLGLATKYADYIYMINNFNQLNDDSVYYKDNNKWKNSTEEFNTNEGLKSYIETRY